MTLDENFKNYGRQVIKNAQEMAKIFMKKNYNVISNGTENHCMLIDLKIKILQENKLKTLLLVILLLIRIWSLLIPNFL